MDMSEYSVMMINKMKLEEIFAANGQLIIVEKKKVNSPGVPCYINQVRQVTQNFLYNLRLD